MFKRTPLGSGFFFVGIIGTIIFLIKLMAGTINQTWGFLMLLMSVIVFIAALISITPELPKAETLDVDKRILELRDQIDKEAKY